MLPEFSASPTITGVSELFAHVWLLHLFCAGLYLCMATYIVARGPRVPLNWSCAAINACFFHWSLSLAVCHHPTTTRATAELFYNIGSFSWASFASFAVLFVAVFLKSKVVQSRAFWPALIVPPALVIYAQWSGWVADDYPARPWGHGYAWQQSFWAYFFFAYYAVYMCGTLGFLLRSALRSEHPVLGRQARIIASTAFLPLGLSSVTDVVLPVFDVFIVPNMAPDFTVIWVVGLVYAIAQYRMLELTPAGAADEIVSTMNDALLLVDPRGDIVWTNRAAQALFGHDSHTAPKRAIASLFPGLSPDAVRTLPKREAGRLSLLARRADGADIHVLLSASTMTAATGEPLGSVLVATDISDLKVAEDRLRSAHDDLEHRVTERTEELSRANTQMAHEVSERQRSEERYRLLIESMQEGLWVIDQDNHTTFVNARLCTVLGYGAKEMLGRSPSEFAEPDDAPVFARDLKDARDGLATGTDWTLVGAAGQTVSAIVQIAPLMEDGKYAGAVLTVVDVTERERLQAQLVHADHMANLGLLAAGVGHEINNPLTYVLDNLRMLEERLPKLADRAPSDEQIRRLLGIVEESREGAERVRDIVQDLRAYSRIQQGELAPVDLNAAIAAAVNMAQNEIRFRARLVTEYGQIPPIMGNQGRISQVFLNLLVNAAHAIGEGSVDQHQIVVRTRCQNGQVLAEVEDTGSGIGPELLPRLFEPFATTKEVGQGFGLGLFICHQTVTAFGGRIEVESKPGVGSLFKLWFPVGRAEKEPSEATQPPRDVVATLSEQLRVLVVDDEPQLRRVVRRALGKQCRVVEADSGERAKEILSHDRRFDAVICDLMMPGMSGMELYEWLTATLPELARRVVFMTGGVFTPRARELLEHAPNPVLPKPFDIEDVRNAVQLVVEDARDAAR